MALLCNIGISLLVYLDGCGIIDVSSNFRRLIVYVVPSGFELGFEFGNVMFSCISEIHMALWNLFDVMWLDVFRVARSGLEVVV